MQIAKMFASMGFNVDTSGLEKFRDGIKLARTDIRNMAGDTKVAATQLRSLSAALDGLSTKLDKISIKKANQNIADSYKEVSKSVGMVDKSLTSIQNNQKGITKALGRIHASVKAGTPLWDNYRASVKSVRDELTSVNGKMAQLRANSTVSLRVNQGTGGSNSQPRQSRDNGFFGNFAGSASGGMMGGFFRSMLPAVALTGGLPAAGFALKEVVGRGREQQRMENILMFAAKDTEEFGDALKFVRKEALRLGLDSAELGKAFAQVNMSAGDQLSTSQKQKMFTDMSEFIMTTGADRTDQKLIFKAINQMFSLGRIQAEEMNQLTERGIPRQMIYNVVKELYGLKSNAEVQKMQEAGKLDPSKILPLLFERFAQKAHTSGAFGKAMSSSQTQQNIATEKFNQLSQQMMQGGLDKMLANLFTGLSNLVDVLSDVTVGLQTAKKALDDMTGGSSGLVTVLTIVSLLFLRKGRAVGVAVKALKNGFNIMRALRVLMGGSFLNAIKMITSRFGLWGLAITGVIVLLQKVGEAMKLRKAGEWTWIDDIIMKFKLVQGELRIAMLGMNLFWLNSKKYLSDPRFFAADWQHYVTVGNGRKSTAGDIGTKTAGNVAQKKLTDATNSNRKAIEEMQKKATIPYAGAGNEWEAPKIDMSKLFSNANLNQQNTFIIDGIRLRNHEVDVITSITT